MEEVVKFLKDADEYYLATMDGDQPRVRSFGTAHVFENRLYIQTGKRKEVSREIHNNPKVEICALKNGEWLRVVGLLSPLICFGRIPRPVDMIGIGIVMTKYARLSSRVSRRPDRSCFGTMRVRLRRTKKNTMYT